MLLHIFSVHSLSSIFFFMMVFKKDKKKCCICGNRTPQYTLHRFPGQRCEEVFQKWVAVIPQLLTVEPDVLRQHGRVCETHFRRDDYYITNNDRLILKRRSIPTLGLPNSPGKADKPINSVRVTSTIISPSSKSPLTPKARQPICSPRRSLCGDTPRRSPRTAVQVDDHNKKVLEMFKKKNVEMFTIHAQDNLVDDTRKAGGIDLESITPKDVNKCGGLPEEITIFQGAKIMLRKNIDVRMGLVNGAIGNIVDIQWPLFRRAQVYKEDIPNLVVDFGKNKTHVIRPASVQFPAKFSYGTIERRMLPVTLAWASTVHKMQGSTVQHAVVYLGSKLFAEGQAYVALSRVRSLEGLQVDELDCTKLTGEKPCNKDAIQEMTRLRNQK